MSKALEVLEVVAQANAKAEEAAEVTGKSTASAKSEVEKGEKDKEASGGKKKPQKDIPKQTVSQK